jgi:hypothetical protein
MVCEVWDIHKKERTNLMMYTMAEKVVTPARISVKKRDPLRSLGTPEPSRQNHLPTAESAILLLIFSVQCAISVQKVGAKNQSTSSILEVLYALGGLSVFSCPLVEIAVCTRPFTPWLGCRIHTKRTLSKLSDWLQSHSVLSREPIGPQGLILAFYKAFYSLRRTELLSNLWDRSTSAPMERGI